MIGERRRQEIRSAVERAGYVEARQLAADLGVDVSTIRRDLDVLARAGVVQRTHGGALPVRADEAVDLPYAVKETEHREAKRAIAAHAASLVADGDSVVLDSGSTTFELARALRDRQGLTVATNDLHTAHYLATGRGIHLLVTGGQLIDSVYTLVGPGALASLADLHVDWAFLGGDAVDPSAGVTNVNTVEVPIKQAMLASAARAVLVADSSKFGRRALAAVTGVEAFERIVTDDGLDPGTRAAYGSRLVCVPAGSPTAAEPAAVAR